ncbi:MAG: lytic transglycosylase domain-containing protein [Acidobacteriota bacterium]
MRVRPVPAWILAAALICSPAPAAPRAELFPAGERLRPRVDFWIQIYSQWTAQQVVFHDAEDLSVIYQVANLEGRRSAREVERFLEPIRERYVEVLENLAAGVPSPPGSEAERVRALFGPGVGPERLRLASENVRYQRGQADVFLGGIVRRGAYEEHLRRIFAAEGIPYDLTYLPHVESSFKLEALSRSGAAGIWQFTRATGRRFLKLSMVVDERWDPIESSRAAARLLKRNYRTLGTWPLAITAYNHGSHGMKRAIRRHRTRNLETLIERYRRRSFGFASKNFYAEFLAAREVAGHPERYFGEVPLLPTLEYELLELDRPVPVQDLLEALGLSICDLTHYNPALRQPVLEGELPLPARYRLKLAAGTLPAGATLSSLLGKLQRAAVARKAVERGERRPAQGVPPAGGSKP